MENKDIGHLRKSYDKSKLNLSKNQSQSMFNPPSSVTLNSSATNDSRLGVMSQQGQPTQSRLFYDD